MIAAALAHHAERLSRKGVRAPSRASAERPADDRKPAPSSYAVEIDPGAFLASAAKGAKLAPTLEEAVSAGVKACGPEFGEFLAQRYGGRVAKAALAACGEG